MSDPKLNAALTKTDVAHIVDRAGTHSLISASLMSSRVITEASAYFERSAKALECILARLQGKDADGAAEPLTVTATLDAASAKAVSDTLSATIQPQLDKLGTTIGAIETQLGKHSEMLGTALAQLAELAQAEAESDAILLGEEGHIRRLEREIAALAARVDQLEDAGDETPPPPAERATSQAREAQEMRAAQEALRERITTIEASIRQMMARAAPEGGRGGGSGGGGPGRSGGGSSRSTRRS